MLSVCLRDLDATEAEKGRKGLIESTETALKKELKGDYNASLGVVSNANYN